jgi:hypothetical protein
LRLSAGSSIIRTPASQNSVSVFSIPKLAMDLVFPSILRVAGVCLRAGRTLSAEAEHRARLRFESSLTHSRCVGLCRPWPLAFQMCFSSRQAYSGPCSIWKCVRGQGSALDLWWLRHPPGGQPGSSSGAIGGLVQTFDESRPLVLVPTPIHGCGNRSEPQDDPFSCQEDPLSAPTPVFEVCSSMLYGHYGGPGRAAEGK